MMMMTSGWRAAYPSLTPWRLSRGVYLFYVGTGAGQLGCDAHTQKLTGKQEAAVTWGSDNYNLPGCHISQTVKFPELTC